MKRTVAYAVRVYFRIHNPRHGTIARLAAKHGHPYSTLANAIRSEQLRRYEQRRAALRIMVPAWAA